MHPPCNELAPEDRTDILRVRPQGALFNFLIYETKEEIEPNRWYQRAHWKNKNFVHYSGNWDTDWKLSDEGKVKVVGLSRGTRTVDFVTLASLDDFKMYLEYDPDNLINEKARKVM